jgi:hypothetical protein
MFVCKLVEDYKPTDGPASKIPAVGRQVLTRGDVDGAVIEAQAKITFSQQCQNRGGVSGISSRYIDNQTQTTP